MECNSMKFYQATIMSMKLIKIKSLGYVLRGIGEHSPIITEGNRSLILGGNSLEMYI